MGIFDMESALKESINSIKKTGVYKQYVDVYSKKLVCIKSPDGTFLSESGDILDDQNRYYVMAEMCAIVETSSKNIESDTDLKIFLESCEL